MSQLDSLNVIHVSGTKGKGTTCAFVESILRHAGLSTGFFSSPHLVSVRERIRINGKPLSQEKFAKYFFEVYNNMEKGKVRVRGKGLRGLPCSVGL
jgi:folylpolyglutamate synthase